jgi:hypothetical protein
MPPAERVLFLFRENPPIAYDAGEDWVQGVECHLYLPKKDVIAFLEELRKGLKEYGVEGVEKLKHEVL